MKALVNAEPSRFGAFLRSKKRVSGLLRAGLLFVAYTSQGADTATWLPNPVDNHWNTPANWSTGTVPSDQDGAVFGVSAIRDLEITESIGISTLNFDAGAQDFIITAQPGVTFQFHFGLFNFSGVRQNFVAASDENGSAAFLFSIDVPTIVGPITFTQQARNAGSETPPQVQFSSGGAGAATFHNLGASLGGGMGGLTNFYGSGASAEEATIINEGASASGATGGSTGFFQQSPSAGNATLIAKGGRNGGGGGSIIFFDASLGGTARLEVFGNGYMDMSDHLGKLSIGSIEGDGQIYLGKATLVVGTNALNTTFSGVLHPGDPNGGGGSGVFSKTGTGILSLTGANRYSAGTIVSQGTLLVSNTSGSGTGPGPVNVNAGTLGGSGIMAGAVTVGTGSGTGASLAPGAGTNKQLTLTTQGALILKADGTYNYTFKGKRNQVRSDLVVANGVSINGASIALSSGSGNRLRRDTVLTVIGNTSAAPIGGTFSNLPDDAIVTVNGNNFQASYSGGDGNDLTLTVVP